MVKGERNALKKKLLMISLDAMVGEDLEIMKSLPGFGEILAKASVVKNVITTYPSLTHPVHVSIATGCYPGRHGVLSNDEFRPGAPFAPWLEDYRLVKVPMLPQVLKDNGYTVASVCWPLTIGMPIDWVLGRAWIHEKRWDERETMRRNSTPGLFDEVAEAVAPCWGREHYEESDMFCSLACEYLLRNHRPDATFVHFVLMDHIRHAYGVFSDQLRPAYEFLDRGIVKMLEAMKAAGTWDDTVVCLTSDHGQLDIDRVVSINRFFRDEGLLHVDEHGALTEWNACCHSGSLSAYIHVREGGGVTRASVKALLERNRERLGIERVFTEEETKREHRLSGGFDLMIETDGHTSFSAKPDAPLVTPTDNGDYRTSVAGHGHLPAKGAKPAFAVRDPFSARRVELDGGRVVDQAPTLAKLLGVEMDTCDGTPIRTFFK